MDLFNEEGVIVVIAITRPVTNRAYRNRLPAAFTPMVGGKHLRIKLAVNKWIWIILPAGKLIELIL